ncbi:MAG TPA: NAD(P)H-dependent oxidoreductase [Gemmatimonadaceae bacterium]|jgi:multimeric flavodoxin WrbA
MAESDKNVPEVRKGQTDTKLSKEEFVKRFAERFFDPKFDAVREAIQAVQDVAWNGYDEYRKDPRTQPAGPEFANPSHPLSIEWLAARRAIMDAQKRHDDPKAKRRILVICASARTDQTCPGEMSKTFRLAGMAKEIIEKDADCECDFLDLSALTSEYGRNIHPCKGCVSTAMPLCHWPCSCYPNYAMGQVNDWMHEIYPRWVEAHGVMIVTPVYWYQAPSVLKLMIDRLVCADGGNPDPTTTHGKHPDEAKALEMKGWEYPRHLEGRAFGVFVHGDTAGTEVLRRSLTDWLLDMHLVQAGHALIDRYIGYYEPYAKSHEALDADQAVQDEVRNVAREVVATVKLIRDDKYQSPGRGIEDPRPK